MTTPLRSRQPAIVLVAGLTVGLAHGAPLALSDTPLIVSTSVEPNVMLLIDNSGSMEQIMWAEGYDPTTTHPVWQYRRNNSWTNIPASGYLRPSQMQQSTCSSGQKRFRRSGSTSAICLNLPDPLGGGNTRIDGNYLRYLLETHPSPASFNTAVSNGTIPTDYRMNVARDVASGLITGTAGMRFGVSAFNYDDGGEILATCGSPQATLTSAVAALTAETWTPLAESLYEITRYFRGLSSYYNAGSYTSPIQYRCQRNFTVVITDGMPTYDSNFPSTDPDDPEGRLPDWDGLSPATSASDFPDFPPFSDGFNPGTESSAEGHALFLDDIAKFARDIDMRKGGTDIAGESFDDPRFPQQYMNTYTVGFTEANQMLEDAAHYGGGQYYTANTASELSQALQSALRDIQERLGSSASAAANAGFIGTGTRVYQARFNSTDWSGQLLAFGIDADPSSATYGQLLTNGSGPEGALWNAGDLLPEWSSRTILSHGPEGGRPMRWNSFSAAEQSSLFDNSQALLEYLRGRDVAGLRTRNTPLGDIVNSAPVYVGAPASRYPDALEDSTYSSFRQTWRNRPTMIYVGANDGMLHGIDADTGVERLAYAPGVVLGKLRQLAHPDYRENHRFFVDGSPTVADAYIDNAWRSVLVGGLNKGGRAIYALDVTDPASFSEANAQSIVLWEFTDPDLGFTYSQPAIARLRDGRWVAIFGNGYNATVADGGVPASSNGNAMLYVVNLANGALIAKLDTATGPAQDPTGANRPNGLATPAPVDLNGDGNIDAVYAGDLYGNMWKFNFSGNNPSLGYRLFSACADNTCSQNNRQPITTRPSVVRHPSGRGQIILFGTGKYLETSDNDALAGGRQTFYGIWDENTPSRAPVPRNSLLEQSIILEQTRTFSNPDGGSHSAAIRVTSNTPVSYSTHRGWHLDLVSPSNGFEGERQVTNPVVRNGRVIFTTLIPTDDPCRPGGDSWLMELDAASGARLRYTPFDLNLDGGFDGLDFIEVEIDGELVRIPVSGMRLAGGAAAAPSILAAEENREFKYISTADGLEAVTENPGPRDTGRQAWRQLTR